MKKYTNIKVDLSKCSISTLVEIWLYSKRIKKDCKLTSKQIQSLIALNILNLKYNIGLEKIIGNRIIKLSEKNNKKVSSSIYQKEIEKIFNRG